MENFGGQPLVHSSMLGIFPDSLNQKQVQLSRWKRGKKLHQILRGWYMIAKPYTSVEVPDGVIANQVIHPSYLSLEWALQYYELIPEHVPALTSITTQRGREFIFRGTQYSYRHVQPGFFFGYSQVNLEGVELIIADPEKSLLDKVYLYNQSSPVTSSWLRELRLQNVDILDVGKLHDYAQKIQGRKFRKGMDLTIQFVMSLKESE